MTDRELILNEIASVQPVIPPLQYAVVPVEYDDVMAQFCKVLGNIGGKYVLVENEAAIQPWLVTHQPSAIWAAQCKAYSNDDCFAATTIICNGTVAVAENAAVWLTAHAMGNRLLPFSCTHLVLVIDAATIVSNMHQAYAVISQQEMDYGVFIAGPSKTADIEQSLVIGAHGPLELTVLIIN